MSSDKPLPTPPHKADRFFSWYCNDKLRETIQGDLHERFYQDLEKSSLRKANFNYWWNVLTFINRHTLKRESSSSRRINNLAMLKNYLLVAVRQMGRNRTHTAINVIGLAIGFTCCLLISLYILDELSYDKFHEKSDRIFRVSSHSEIGGNERHWSLIPSKVVPALKNELPIVEDFTRIATISKSQQLVKYKQEVYDESGGDGSYGKVFVVDSSFFKVFTFDFEQGNPELAVAGPNKVVITQTVADKIFKDQNAFGQTLEFANLGTFEVTGILRDLPKNSHLQFGYLLSGDFTPAPPPSGFFWVRGYVVLRPNAKPETLEAQVDTIGNTAETSLAKNGVNMEYFIQPLADIHLTSGLEYELYPTNDINQIYIFFAISLFILIIASINFVNLSTAHLSKRAKEVGIRKVMGARRGQMVFQFFVQSILVSVISAVLALVFFVFTISPFNLFVNKNLSFSFLMEPATGLFILGVVLLIGVLAGVYPAVVLSRFNPVMAIKENIKPGSASQILRKILVVFQFGISVILIASTYTIVQQLHFLKNQNLGFDSTNMVSVPIDRNQSLHQLSVLRNELSKISGISAASLSSGSPGKGTNVMVMTPEGYDQANSVRIDGIYADFDFVSTYDLQLIAGRDFDHRRPSDSINFLVNKTAVAKFGWSPEEAIGKDLDFPSNTPVQAKGGKIIGVTEDFHYKSLHDPIGPLMIGIHSTNFPLLGLNLLSLKISSSNLSSTLSEAENTWNKIYPDKPFNYTLVDQTLEKQYQNEDRLGQIITSFAALAIMVACMGLLGLALFITQQKAKEIGIRKILGASVSNILSKLSSGFVVLIVMGNVIGWPVAYYLLSNWLNGFAYHVDISFWVFVAAGISSGLVALLTIGYRTFLAATANPVNSLRYE